MDFKYTRAKLNHGRFEYGRNTYKGYTFYVYRNSNKVKVPTFALWFKDETYHHTQRKYGVYKTMDEAFRVAREVIDFQNEKTG